MHLKFSNQNSSPSQEFFKKNLLKIIFLLFLTPLTIFTTMVSASNGSNEGDAPPPRTLNETTSPAADHPSSPTTRVVQVDTRAVFQFVPEGFENLDLNRKLFIYYLSKASRGIDELIWAQVSREGRSIRNLMNELWRWSSLFPTNEKEKIAEYLFDLYLFKSNYNPKSNVKIHLDLKENQMEKLIKMAKQKAKEEGQSFGFRWDEWDRLKKDILDPKYRPIYKYDGKIVLSQSGFYGPGVTKRDIESIPDPAVRLNPFTHIIKKLDGTIQVLYYHLGRNGIMKEELQSIYNAIDSALPYAKDDEKTALISFQQLLRKGSFENYEQAWRDWTRINDPTVVFILSQAIETYNDPLGVRGTASFNILIQNLSHQYQNLANILKNNVEYFEGQRPGPDSFKKTDFSNPMGVSSVSYLLSIIDSIFSGVILPNDLRYGPYANLTDRVGVRSFSVSNLDTQQPNGDQKGGSNSKDSPEYKFYKLFPPELRPLAEKYSVKDITTLEVLFHEILGHGGGKVLEGVETSRLKSYNTLEEGRAELAALHFIFDPKLRSLDLLPEFETESAYKDYLSFYISTFFVRAVLLKYYSLNKDNPKISQAHLLADHCIMNAMIKSGAIKVELNEDNVPNVKVVDLDKVKSESTRLLELFQTIISTGNTSLENTFFEQFQEFGEEHRLWKSAIDRFAETELKHPKLIMWVNPEMSLVYEQQPGSVKPSGPRSEPEKILDVHLKYHEPIEEGSVTLAEIIDPLVSSSRVATPQHVPLCSSKLSF